MVFADRQLVVALPQRQGVVDARRRQFRRRGDQNGQVAAPSSTIWDQRQAGYASR
jgi:hypothetical protein